VTVRRVPRWLVFGVVVLVLAAAALTSVGVSSVRSSFPEASGRITLPGLTAPVEVLRDGYGVPHIYADTAEDLFLAQGYVHAQDRFYEMDFRRHLAAGRLSELYGPSQLQTDAYVRTLGWRRVAEQELSLLAPSTRRALDAYAAGVNAYLGGRSAAELSLEYRLLGLQGLSYTPDRWTAADSVSWLKVMAWDLGSNLSQEAERALVTAAFGVGRTANLFPDYPHEDYAPIVGRGTVVDKKFVPTARRRSAHPLPDLEALAQPAGAGRALAEISRMNAALAPLLRPRGMEGETGSNSWVVSGSRTATGRPLLSNDPHLAASIPSVFAQVGLHCRTVNDACPYDVAGFSLASVPGVVIGHNTSIAWGLTTSHLDVQDLYLEQVEGNQVRVGDRLAPLETVTEQIRVAGDEEPRTITIRSSRHGPLLSDVSPQLQRVATTEAPPGGPGYGVALSWVGLTPGRTVDAILGINQAQNFDEFREAAALLAAPSQNLVYADVAGNIGYQLPGMVPRRGQGDGRSPSPGWDEAYDWRGMIPFAELPWVYNPPGGVLVAANQPVIGGQYPHRLGSAYSYGWRSQEILDQLRQTSALTLDEAEALLYDDTIRIAAELVPALLKIKVTDSWVAEGQRTLVGWDYSAAPDSAPAAYFNVVMHNILKLTFRDELPEELWPVGGDRWNAVVSGLLEQPRNLWWDDVTTPEVTEARDDILRLAMTNARKEITSLMARDTDEWAWGRLHTVTLRNQTLGMSGIKPVEALFNRGPYEVGGGPAVVNAMAYDTTKGYTVTSAPTMRMVVDLGNLDQSRWVNQSGVSGHAFHRNYADQTELWARNETWPFVSTRAAVEARTEQRQELRPGG
jgi:penicillin amidase